MSDNPMDDVGSDAAQMLRIMLQLAALIMLRARTRGHEQAQAIGKEHNARTKEAREQQLREARQSKARDPRNRELAMMLDVPVLNRPVSLDKGPPVPMRWDSDERRAHLAAHLSRVVPPELAQVRMLVDVGQAQPSIAAVTRHPDPVERTAQRTPDLVEARRRALIVAQAQGREQ